MNESKANDHLARAWACLATVADPEIPVLSLVELGVIRDIVQESDTLVVRMTPTYAGCPAIEVMQADAQAALTAIGIASRIETVLNPPWSSAWLSEAAREKLRGYGIAPPHLAQIDGEMPLNFYPPRHYQPPCPQCKSKQTERLSEFGSTACKALYRCLACLEPFDYFKPY